MMHPADLLALTGIGAAPAGMPPINWLVLAPQAVLVVVSMVMMALDMKFWSKYKHWVGFAGGVGFVLAALVAWFMPTGSTYGGMVVFDGLAKGAFLLFCALGLITSFLSLDYLNREDLAQGEYYILMMFSVIGMVVMTSTRELLTFFIGLETLSVPLYVLSGFSLYNRKSIEAGLKYLLLGAFGSAFFIFGVALIYGATGSLTFDGIHKAYVEMKEGANALTLFHMGFAMVLTGLAFKISLAPFHLWTPDVYEGSPTPITAFMSVGTKAAAVIGLLRFLQEAVGPDKISPAMTATLMVLAVLTMIVGNTGAIMQRNVKRLLAYSSIAHAGYLMVGFVVFDQAARVAIVYYLAGYLFMTMGAFGVLIALAGRDDSRLTVDDFNGLGLQRPGLAAFMTLCLLSMAGIPPTVGFISKFYLFGGVIGAGYYKLAAVGLLTSVIAVYYYLKVVVAMYMKPAPAQGQEQPYTMSPVLTIGLILSGAGIILVGLFPSLILSPLTRIFSS